MKRPWITGLLIILGVAGASQGFGQTPIPSTNVDRAEFPRIRPDLRVTFQVKAPEAKKVEFELGKRYTAEKDADGYWTATTEPQAPGFHYYWILLDGVPVNDPSSETFFGYGKPTSGIEIPEKGVDFSSFKDVPHGEVRERWYRSRTTQAARRINVYTPPGYDTDIKARYPVLYLQHGAGENDRGWANQGRISFILDNLIAEKKAKPMIVVMEHGYATKPDKTQTAKAGSAKGDLGRTVMPFEEVVVNDLIPMIDATYRTRPDRENRAIAGLSMGGMQALQIGLNHLDLFASIATFSSAGHGLENLETAYNGAMADPEAFNKKVKVFWMGVGTSENLNLLTSMKYYHKALEASGIKSVYYESPGTDHEWLTWRRCLHDFAPRLFTNVPST